jgi:membrane associated rhomboid family serine protease
MLLGEVELEQTGSMRSRFPATSNFSYSFGPGPLTPAIKTLVIANVAAFLLSLVAPAITLRLGMRPADVVGQLHLWQLVTYMFLHGGIFHILFNMLALWMFGVELERMWGSRFFTKFYFVSGIGAAATTLVLSFMPVPFADQLYYALTIGASGAVYGVLLAYAMYFPNRPIYMYFFFPIPAKYFVPIIGGISLLSSMSGPGGGIAHTTHLGGLLAAYLYLKDGRTHVLAEIKYRYLKWRINRMRKRFDVYSGGRADDVNRRVH